MPKLDYLGHKKLTSADELRELLSSLEERRVKLSLMDSPQVLNLLQDLDQTALLLPQVEASGVEVQAELSRFTSLQASLKSQPGVLLKSLGGAATLNRHRPAPRPSPDRWWWYLDDMAAAQRRRRFRQITWAVVVGLLLIGGVVLAFQTVLAPSPQVIARLEAQNEAEAASNEGNYQAALAAIDQGLAAVPGDPELLLYQGILRQLLSQTDGAGQSFEQAQLGLADPVSFYLSRGQLWLRFGQAAAAEADARAILKLDENSAKGWLLLGRALEWQNQVRAALAAYQTAANLAFASGEAEVIVLARTALARLATHPELQWTD